MSDPGVAPSSPLSPLSTLSTLSPEDASAFGRAATDRWLTGPALDVSR